MLIGNGTFEGRGGHVLRGTFTLNHIDGSIIMETDNDFFFDGSPEPGWALSAGVPMDANDPSVRAAALSTRFGEMPGGIVEVKGRQVARIASASLLDGKDTIFLWCFYTPFLLGVGPIEFT